MGFRMINDIHNNYFMVNECFTLFDELLSITSLITITRQICLWYQIHRYKYSLLGLIITIALCSWKNVSPVRAQDRTSTINVSTALIKTNGYGIKDAKSVS